MRGGEGGVGVMVMVGTRLGHLRGLLGRKSHAPRLLLPTHVPSFDCKPMNNAWGTGREKGGETEGLRGGGDLNIRGALPQWESLLMNNYSDEPERERTTEREREREGGVNGGEKQTKY